MSKMFTSSSPSGGVALHRVGSREFEVMIGKADWVDVEAEAERIAQAQESNVVLQRNVVVVLKRS